MIEQGPSIRLSSHKVENSRTKSNPQAIGQNIAKTKNKAAKPYERSKSLDFVAIKYSLNFLHHPDLVHAVAPLDVSA